jgi:protein-tyrosine-phosphatase
MKVLFICKYNRFRSRVATAYFNRLNRNSKCKAKGVGIYPNNDPLDKWEVSFSKKLGIDIRGKPKKVSERLLKWADLVVIVADDVKKSQIKHYKKYKILVWKVKDTEVNDKKGIKRIIKEIIKRVDVFSKRLKKESI